MTKEEARVAFEILAKIDALSTEAHKAGLTGVARELASVSDEVYNEVEEEGFDVGELEA